MQYTLKYEIKSGTTCKVVGFEGEPTEVNIPEEVEIEGKNYSITNLAPIVSNFRSCSKVRFYEKQC